MKKRVRLGGKDGALGGGMNPLVTIEVRSRSGAYVPLLCCVDTGAHTSSIPIPMALHWSIRFTQQTEPGTVRGMVGTTKAHLDRIHVRLFGEEFSWPCYFIEPYDPSRTFDYAVIGRMGFNASFNSCQHLPFCLIRRRTGHLPLWQRVRAFFAPWQELLYNEPL